MAADRGANGPLSAHRSTRALPAALALVLALAFLPGCSGTAASKSTGTGASAGAPTSVPAAGRTTSNDAGGATSAPVEPTSEPAARGARATTSTTAAAPIDGAVPVGQLAPALLRAAGPARLDLELRSQAGAEPDPASIEHLVSVLRRVSAKSVQLQRGPAVAGGARDWSSQDIAAAAADGEANTSDTVVVHLLFLRGSFGGDPSVLGAATRGDLAAVFSDQVRASADLVSGPQPIEVATATHELGHLIGLVDLYLRTGRGDPQHPGHSTNQKSVMYWAVDSSLVGSLLGQRPPADFDASDLADLSAIRNGA